MLVSCFRAFFSFCTLAFVGFLLLSKVDSHKSSRFTLLWKAIFGSWFGWYALCFRFQAGSNEILIFFIWTSSFRYFPYCIEFISYSYHIFIAYIYCSMRNSCIYIPAEALRPWLDSTNFRDRSKWDWGRRGVWQYTQSPLSQLFISAHGHSIV